VFTNYLNKYSQFTNRKLEFTDYLIQSYASQKNEKPMAPDSVNRIVKDYAEKLNINKDISAHSCRATAISFLLEKGESPRNVADFAGHSSIETTVSIYDKKRDNLNNSSAYKVDYKS
jgi:site-specific recombinase XerD